MQRFSHAMAELYAVALASEPDRFALDAIRLLHKLVQYDRTVFFLDRRLVHIEYSALSGTHVVCDRLPPMLERLLYDIVGEQMRASRVLQLWPGEYSEDDPAVQGHAALARQLGAAHLLCNADARAGDPEAGWIVLLRADGETFSMRDAELLSLFWQHVRQGWIINLRQALGRCDVDRRERAMGMVNAHGDVEVADSRMCELIRQEWPEFDGRTLDRNVVKSLLGHGQFRGRCIEISSFEKHGYLVCAVRKLGAASKLGPSELNVASRFASGMSHKQIAAHLNVSPYTVRNQLAQVYQKLGVHGKAELVRALWAS